MNKLAILIAFRNSTIGSSDAVEDLVICLKSVLTSANKLIEQSKNKYIPKVYIVDDHSKEKYDHLIPISILNQITIISNKDSLGQGNALNFGLKKIRATYYAITDSDCIIDINWLFNIVTYFKNTPNRNCVVGPNWIHQKPIKKWQKYITDNESKLMKYIYKSYIDYNKKTSLRIDCRNLAIKNSFLKISKSNIFSDSIFTTSSQTSYNWRNSDWDMSHEVGYSNQLIVYHKYIPSLRKHINKYYKRGKYGDFKNMYSKKYNLIIIAFIKKYFHRHFIAPIYTSGVSILYLWLVHSAFWIGIVMDKKSNKSNL